jgi:thiol-disulfide isomerase/thioredoxin
MAVAQQPNGGKVAQDITENGLRIGDEVPALDIASIHNYKSKTANTADFKGKLLILDFWATWCSPCVAMMPKMQQLQKDFDGQVQFLSVTNQKEKEVLEFVSKLEPKFHGMVPMVTDDKLLASYFPHRYLPHYVWIDQQGKVIAITEGEQINSENISSALKQGNTIALKKKVDYRVAYDKGEPLFIDGNGGKPDGLIFHSVLTHHQKGLNYEYTRKPLDDTSKIRLTFKNYPVIFLFGHAMGAKNGAYGIKKMRFLVRDTSKLLVTGDMLRWAEKNTYCYELVLPKAMESMKYEIMLNELKRFFPQYKVEIEKQEIEVLALIRLDSIDRLRSKGGEAKNEFSGVHFELKNHYIHMLVSQLSLKYLQNYPLPVMNDTGYKEKVDLMADADLSNVDSLNRALRNYGLLLKPTKKQINILVFRDI